MSVSSSLWMGCKHFTWVYSRVNCQYLLAILLLVPALDVIYANYGDWRYLQHHDFIF